MCFQVSTFIIFTYRSPPSFSSYQYIWFPFITNYQFMLVSHNVNIFQFKFIFNWLIRSHQDGVAYFDDRDAPMVILRGAVKPVAWPGHRSVFEFRRSGSRTKKSPSVHPYLNLNDPNKYVPIVSFSWWGFFTEKNPSRYWVGVLTRLGGQISSQV